MGRRRSVRRQQGDQAPRRRFPIALRLAATAVVVIAAVGVAAVLLLTRGSGEPSGPRAAIIDQLTLTQPNPAFADDTTRLLEDAGYSVDYFPGEQVTVDFYRDLPKRNYDLIIFRAHSARVKESDRATLTDEVAIFTGEPYDATKYLDEQYSHRLNVARHHESTGNETFYFAMGPGFIRDSMKGRFNGTTVILMGCDALSSDTAAQAFIDKGASAVTGWSGQVTAPHTDDTTERLLQYLVSDGLDAQDAASRAAADMGPDPSYGSTLLLYPTATAAASP